MSSSSVELEDIALIAAVAENNVIGVDGDLPWHYPEDLARFKRLTAGHPIIMGRGTWESLGVQPLPDRTNIVLTSRPLPSAESSDRIIRAESIQNALECAAEHDAVAYGIGGESVYRQLLPQATRLELTHVHESVDGDTYFPDWNRDDWACVSRDERDEFTFATYQRSN